MKAIAYLSRDELETFLVYLFSKMIDLKEFIKTRPVPVGETPKYYYAKEFGFQASAYEVIKGYLGRMYNNKHRDGETNHKLDEFAALLREVEAEVRAMRKFVFDNGQAPLVYKIDQMLNAASEFCNVLF